MSVLPSLYKPTNAGKFILDLAFRDCALIMRESGLLINSKLNMTLPIPLIGFQYDTPSNLSLLKYNYCEYPFLNKTMIVNSLVKENGSVTVSACRPILRTNPAIVSTIANQAIIKGVETYASRGGTWILLTMWGMIQDLVLEELSGSPTDGGIGGVMYEFKLKKINFSNMQEVGAAADNLIAKATGGII